MQSRACKSADAPSIAVGETIKNMILVVGDLHLRDRLGYADLIPDGRKSEEKDILDFIVNSANGCNTVVFMGDNLNAKNNTSAVINKFVNLIERFGNRQIYILAGNHEKFANGNSAIDFLREVNKPNWHIITKKIEKHEGMVFLPFFTPPERHNMEELDKFEGDILFAHHAIGNTTTETKAMAELFNEPIINREMAEKKFQLVIGGHVHKPQVINRTVITGSVFNNEVGEVGKSIWKIATLDMNYYELDLPGRKIIKLENPTDLDLLARPNTIVKVVITDRKLSSRIPEIKRTLREETKNGGAGIVIERYPNERTKVHFEEGMLEFPIEKLIEIYAVQKKLDPKKLLSAYNLI